MLPAVTVCLSLSDKLQQEDEVAFCKDQKRTARIKQVTKLMEGSHLALH